MVPVAQGAQVPNGDEVPSYMRPSHPQRRPMWQVDETPARPVRGVMPQWPAQHRVGRRMSVTPAEANYGIPTQRHYRAGMTVAQNIAPASAPMSTRAPQQRLPSASSGPGMTSASLSGFLPEGTGTWLVFLGAGVVGGVALRMLLGGKK